MVKPTATSETMMASPAGIRARYRASRERPVITRWRNMPSVRSTDPAVQPERGRDDEAEDVQHAGDQLVKMLVAAGRAVGLGGDGVRDQPDGEEDRRGCRW